MPQVGFGARVQKAYKAWRLGVVERSSGEGTWTSKRTTKREWTKGGGQFCGFFEAYYKTLSWNQALLVEGQF